MELFGNRQWLLLTISTILILALFMSECNGQEGYCDIQPPATNPGANFPRLPPSFQTRIELNIVHKQETIEAYENFDLPNNRSSLRMTREVRETFSYVDYSSNEVHVVYDKNKCVSASLDQVPGERILFGKLTINGVSYTYSVVSALKFGLQFGQKYKGRDTVRGILADHWQSCQHWTEPESNFTVDYYFAVPEWKQTLGAIAMPVRAVVEGVSNHGPTGNHFFKHIYDFLDFQPFAEKNAASYQTPDGVYCEGRKKTRDVPVLPQSFRYKGEFVQPWSSLNTGIIFNLDIWYDYDHKLGRYDFALPVPLTFIFDYRIGVRYMKNTQENTCAMVGFQIWSKGPPGNNQLVLEMINPMKIFFLDGSYIYTGKTMHRKIPCDRYISKKTFGQEADNQWNATIEYCIIDHTFVEIGDTARTVTKDVPMTMRFNTGEFQAAANLFDFEHIDMGQDMKMFDVVDCYQPGNRKDVMITFPAYYFDKIAMYKGKFISDVIARISKVAHVSPIRVQRPRVDYDATNTYFTSTILDRVPFKVLFKPNEDGDNVGLVSVDDRVENVRFEQLCAEMCQDMKDDNGQYIKCNSFAYCFSDNRCLLSTNHVARPGTVDISQHCRRDTVKYYNRAVPAPDIAEVKLGDGIRDLKNSILAGDFKIYFKPTDGDELKVYTASDIRTGFKRGDGDSTEKMVKDFNQIRKASAVDKYVRVEIDSALSLDECANACERSDHFVCQSFTFCAAAGRCLLSADHPEEHRDMMVNTSSCDVYSRNYLQKFKHYMGRSLGQGDAKVLKDIQSTDRCAQLCVSEQTFHCKSFDYCRSNGHTCRLNKKHVLDMPSKEGNLSPAPNCDHFSRMYIDDFKMTNSGQFISLKDVNIMRDVDTTECAKRCVETLGNECKAFDHCGNETYCVLSSDYYRRKSVGKVVSSQEKAFCAHYSRISFPDGSSFTPQKVQVNKGYSSGAMAGLGFGMIILGMLLLVVIVAIVNKVRGGSLQDMTSAVKGITNPAYSRS